MPLIEAAQLAIQSSCGASKPIRNLRFQARSTILGPEESSLVISRVAWPRPRRLWHASCPSRHCSPCVSVFVPAQIPKFLPHEEAAIHTTAITINSSHSCHNASCIRFHMSHGISAIKGDAKVALIRRGVHGLIWRKVGETALCARLRWPRTVLSLVVLPHASKLCAAEA